MGRVSLIDGHIDGAENCVICGKDIPEGNQVCNDCTETEKENAVDIIRCKNCKHYNPCETTKGWCDLYESVVRENYSCNFGRKESEVTE